MSRKYLFPTVLILAISWFVLLLVSSTFGPASISLRDTFHLWFSNADTSYSFSVIYWDIRLPRLVLASITGAALAVSGAAFQSIFKNPMADPYVLGISSGASLGATLAIVFGWEAGMLGTTGMAFVFAVVTVLVVYQVASSGKRLNSEILLLSGISLSFLMSALVSLMLVIHRDKMEKIIFWTLGGFNVSSWNQVLLLVSIVVVGIGIVYFYATKLNIMMLGSEAAPTLGVNTRQTTRVLLVTCSLMIAAVVSNSGVVGFVGLIVPHLVRAFTGPDNRVVIPISIFAGAIFLMLSDTLARNLMSPSELPVGCITALLGVPYFLYLLYKSRQTI